MKSIPVFLKHNSYKSASKILAHIGVSRKYEKIQFEQQYIIRNKSLEIITKQIIRNFPKFVIESKFIGKSVSNFF